MVGIKDIAKAAGVSISTVSYALNNSPKVTEETRKRVLKISNKMGYIPNAAARSMKRRETRIVGAYILDYSGAFFGSLLKGMKEALAEYDYELIVCSGIKSHRMIPERVVDGAIILDASFADRDILEYGEMGCKLVVLDRTLNHENVGGLILDNCTGVRLALEELLKQKTKRLYIITGSKGTYDSQMRLIAAREFLENHRELEVIEVEGNFDIRSGELAGEEIFRDISEPVSVFAFNDEMAVGVYNYAREHGYTIGKDVYLIGFDDIDICHYLEPTLTTVGWSKYNWGAMAAKKLMELLSGEAVEQDLVKLRLMKRNSHKDTMGEGRIREDALKALGRNAR